MNKFKDKFKSLVSNVSVEVTTQKSIMDKKNSIKKYQKEIQERYQILGEKFFANHKSKGDIAGEELTKECHKIQEILTLIDNTQAQIEEIMKEKEETKKSEDQTVVVPKANEIFMDKEMVKNESARNIFCKNCGNEIEGDAKFCCKCGTKI